MAIPSYKSQLKIAQIYKSNIANHFFNKINNLEDPYGELKNNFKKEDNFLTINEFEDGILDGFLKIALKIIEDESLSDDERKIFDTFISNSENFSEKLYIKIKSSRSFLRSFLIYEIAEQITAIKENSLIEKNNPGNISLSKEEKIVFIYPNVNGYRLDAKVKYKGSSTGVSKNLGKGWTVRHSRFSGEAVPYTEWVKCGSGELIVTNKNIYLTAPTPLKEKYSTLSTFVGTKDGVICNTTLKTRPAVRFQFLNNCNTQSWSLIKFLTLSQTI